MHRTSPQSALGGQAITTTVEGRERFPVRIRYARDFRLDEESIKQLLVSGSAGQSAADSERDLTTMIGLVPMLWATGTGSEIMRPMAAPVLGGILASDEVVDMLLPVLFYHVRKWRWRRIHRGRAASSEALPARIFEHATASV